MRVVDIMRRAGRNLLQAKGRTLLTSLAIAVGAFTLTASLALGQGMRDYTDTALKSNVNPQAIYFAKDKNLLSFSGGFETFGSLKEYDTQATNFGGMTYKTLSPDDIQAVESIANVERVDPYYMIDARYVQFEGSDKKYVSQVNMYDPSVLVGVAAGALPSLNEQLEHDEAVIPESYAETMGKSPDELIGTTVSINLAKTGKRPTEQQTQEAFMAGGQEALERLFAPEEKTVPVTIRAVSKKTSTSFTAATGVFVSKTKAEEMTNYLTEGTDQYKNYLQATAIVKDGVDPASVAEEMKSRGVSTVTAEEYQATMFQMVNIMMLIVAVFGLLALIASVFGIINTQYISVLERTSQIGLMKALGMSRRAVGKMFRYEAAWIGFLGGVIGSTAAVVLGTVFNPVISEAVNLGDDIYLLKFVWWQIALLILFLMLVAIVSGWFPSRKAAKLDPIEALRTE